eukprot:jgi/Chlat1/5659/Chrsp37S05479
MQAAVGGLLLLPEFSCRPPSSLRRGGRSGARRLGGSCGRRTGGGCGGGAGVGGGVKCALSRQRGSASKTIVIRDTRRTQHNAGVRWPWQSPPPPPPPPPRIPGPLETAWLWGLGLVGLGQHGGAVGSHVQEVLERKWHEALLAKLWGKDKQAAVEKNEDWIFLQGVWRTVQTWVHQTPPPEPEPLGLGPRLQGELQKVFQTMVQAVQKQSTSALRFLPGFGNFSEEERAKFEQLAAAAAVSEPPVVPEPGVLERNLKLASKKDVDRAMLLASLADLTYSIREPAKVMAGVQARGLRFVTTSLEGPCVVDTEPEVDTPEQYAFRSEDDRDVSKHAANLAMSALRDEDGTLKTPRANDRDVVRTLNGVASPAHREDEDEGARTEQELCPCEYFICDDDKKNIRYIVIQGSESLASWQANISFYPVAFEGSDTVKVHRGIYQIALALFDKLQPCIKAYLTANPKGRISFTGHSLGGSLSVLLALLLLHRGEVPLSAVEPIWTFGAPSVVCGGDAVLARLGIPRTFVQNVCMHFDIVPRAFSCEYPDGVADVLRRVEGSFRAHACLRAQKLLYPPLGTIQILHPSEHQAPRHPLLPKQPGMYQLKQPPLPKKHKQNEPHVADCLSGACGIAHVDPAEREYVEARDAFLNKPHPLEILKDPYAYGYQGTIARDHDPQNYIKALQTARELIEEQSKSNSWVSKGLHLVSSVPAMLGSLSNQPTTPRNVAVAATKQQQQHTSSTRRSSSVFGSVVGRLRRSSSWSQ